MKWIVLLLLGTMQASGQTPDIYYACTFATLPNAVFHYPSNDGPRTVRIGGRPAEPFNEGQGSGRIATADVDGYRFRFAPGNQTMDVVLDGETIASEQGQCISVNGPIAEDPLEFGQVEEPTSNRDVGDWSVREDISSFDDSKTVVLHLESSDTVTDRFGGGRRVPSLIVRCKENTTSLYIIAGGHYLADIQGYGTVDYRVDDRPASEWSMEASTDNEALGLWTGRRAIPAVKNLFGGSSLSVRLTPFSESPLEFSFPITGLEEAIAPLRKACSW